MVGLRKISSSVGVYFTALGLKTFLRSKEYHLKYCIGILLNLPAPPAVRQEPEFPDP